MKRALLVLAAITVIAGQGVFAGARRDTAQPANDVRLTMLHVWNGGHKVPTDQYNNPVAKAIREKTGVTVTFEGIMMSETERLNLMFASGDMPDIVNGPFWGGMTGETGVIKKAASEGMLLPIEALLDKYPNVKRAFDVGVSSQKYLETDLRDPLFNGHLYVIPSGVAGNADEITNWAYGAFVRGDVPKTLGVDVSTIKTSQQLYEFMVRVKNYGFKDVNGNDTIVATTYHQGWDYGRYAESFGPQKLTNYIDNGNGTITHYWLTQDWIDRNIFLWRLVNDGLLDKECFRTDDTLADMKVGNGTALFYAAQYIMGINSTKQTGLYNAHPEMRYIPIGPLNDLQGNPLVQVESMGSSGSGVIFFPTTNKNLEATLRYIDYVNTPEGMALVRYGVEGQTFVRNAQGQPRLVPDLLARKLSGDTSWEDVVRQVGGMGYISGPLTSGSLNKTWFGESDIGGADAAVQEQEDYRKQRPVKQFPGYALNAFETQFPNYTAVSRVAFEGDPERTYRERAYFATTEAEARRILLDFQNHLRTADNGVFMQFLDFLAQKAKSRNDIAF
jgi:putative aldouronate transport system substrate-binding protein